jgi:ferric-dicitrate binding protein FerR (iron transport regulator)
VARHVAPHRWADAAAGRLSSAQVAKLEAHAAKCARCAEARDRVLAAREAFDDIRDQEAPQLGWDHIGARVYWVTSSERRAAGRNTDDRRFAPWLAFAGAGVLALVAVVVVGISAGWFTSTESAAPVAEGRAEDRAPAQPPAPAAVRDDSVDEEPAAQLRGVVTFAKGDVSVNGAPLSFDEPIGVGLRLSTGQGSVAVQFGAGTGFRLAEDSELLVRSFDERNIELVLDGEIALDIARRANDQRLAVLAGERTVTVRGTAFRVTHRKGALDVTCSRGHVVVSDRDGQLDVKAGESLHLDFGDQVLKANARHLRAREIEALDKELTVPMLPAWTDTDALFATSAALDLAAPADAAVKVDGIEYGTGAFALRVMSGRHHVETRGQPGEWVDLGAGERQVALRAPPPASSSKLRRRQVARALEKRAEKIRQLCLRREETQGILNGSYVVLDIGVERDGSLGHLNIDEHNISSESAACVRDEVDHRLNLSAGPQATVRYRLAY